MANVEGLRAMVAQNCTLLESVEGTRSLTKNGRPMEYIQFLIKSYCMYGKNSEVHIQFLIKIPTCIN